MLLVTINSLIVIDCYWKLFMHFYKLTDKMINKICL